MAVNRGTGTGVEQDGAEPIELLACGRDAAQVWDHAARSELDEHERGCPHCAAAGADARTLDRLVHRMAAEPLAPPPSVMDQVMGAVLAELRPPDLLSLASPYGPARLSRPAAAAVLRHVVDRVGGMQARSCRIAPLAEAGGTGPTAVLVAMTVTAQFGVDLASVSARVRQLLVAAGEQALGIPVCRVDIDIVDVFDDTTPRGNRS